MTEATCAALVPEINAELLRIKANNKANLGITAGLMPNDTILVVSLSDRDKALTLKLDVATLWHEKLKTINPHEYLSLPSVGYESAWQALDEVMLEKAGVRWSNEKRSFYLIATGELLQTKRGVGQATLVQLIDEVARLNQQKRKQADKDLADVKKRLKL